VTCSGCGLGRLQPQPSREEISTFYPAEYYGVTGSKFEPVVETMVRCVGARHARLLSRGIPRGGRVLDFGCGRGVTLSALADRGFEVHGVEMSREAAQGADPRARIRIAPRLAEAAYPEAHFDQVVMWHVLEHLPDPRETLDEVYRILRPHGRLIVAVPNSSSLQARWAGESWFHLDLPRHLFHFPLSALVALLERCGFDSEARYHFSLRQNPFGWVQSALNRCHRIPRNSLYQRLHRRTGRDDELADRSMRFQLCLAYFIGMPVGLAASMVAALLRQGATVSVVARKRS
jgi:SAM-dependent methyltransferase